MFKSNAEEEQVFNHKQMEYYNAFIQFQAAATEVTEILQTHFVSVICLVYKATNRYHAKSLQSYNVTRQKL